MIFYNTNKMKFVIFAAAIIYLLSVTVSKRARHHRRHMTVQNFSASCTGTKFTADTHMLSSNCKDMKGKAAPFDLNLDTCFANMDGVLKKGGGYAKTCIDCTMEATTLKCTCKTANGKKVPAHVDVNSFINNTDGKLTC